MRVLEESLTYTFPEESTAMSFGPLNCPLDVPREPHFVTNEYPFAVCIIGGALDAFPPCPVVFVAGGDGACVVGAGLNDGAAFTMTDTIEGLLLAAPLSSLTVSENFNVVSDDKLGAVNVGFVVLLLFNLTAGPANCVHE